MEEEKKKYNEVEYEDSNFVCECLDSFDENVAKIDSIFNSYFV